MGLSNTQYRDIMYKYDQLRLKNKRLVASRYEELYEKIPELRNIQNEIINQFQDEHCTILVTALCLREEITA